MKNKRVGYARVSTDKQETQQQIDALNRAGCEHVFTDDGVSGYFTAAFERQGFLAAISAMSEGDTLVVVKLDRLGRSVPDLIATTMKMQDMGLNFASLGDHIDTTSAVGKMTFHVLASVAQFERDITSERTKAAMQAFREGTRKTSTGKPWHRPRLLSDAKLDWAEAMMQEQGVGPHALARQLKVSYHTLWRALNRRKEEKQRMRAAAQAKAEAVLAEAGVTAPWQQTNEGEHDLAEREDGRANTAGA